MIELKSSLRIILVYANVVIGGVNVGYSMTYTNRSQTTIYQNLGITDQNDISNINPFLNGSYTLGAVLGSFIGYLMLLKISTKLCLILSDVVCVLSILVLVNDLYMLMAFRFILGISGGMSSIFGSVYTRGSCPDQLYFQISMFINYGVSIGYLLGYLIDIGYPSLEFDDWWRFVFAVPAILSCIRTFNIMVFFNYENPFEKSARKEFDHVRNTVEAYYKPECVEQVFEIYKKRGLLHPFHLKFNHIFQREHFVQLHVTVLTVNLQYKQTIGQIWCGQFIMYQLAPINFNALTNNNVLLVDEYLFYVALVACLIQPVTVPLTTFLGNRYTLSNFQLILVLGYLVIAILNSILAILQDYSSNASLDAQFVIFFIYVSVYACTLGPVGWAIVPQTTDMDGVCICFITRWASQSLIILCFPSIKSAMAFQGTFIFFVGSNILFTIYTIIYIKDTRGKTIFEVVDLYKQQAYTQINTIESRRTDTQRVEIVEQPVYSQKNILSNGANQ